MIYAMTAWSGGTTPAWSLSNLSDRVDIGFEEPLVGKKSKQRSLRDDAFDAEESVNRRSRVMGQQFADSVDDAASGDDLPRRRDEPGADPTEDPVRMYLMQMGQIPLLTREQEVSAAKQIERTRERYRKTMLATDFMLQGALKLLEQVRDKKASA